MSWFRFLPVLPNDYEEGIDELVEEIQCLKRRLDIAESKAELIVTTISILGFQLQFKRVPTAAMKSAVIDPVNNAAESLGLNVSLDLIKLSKARFSVWPSRQKQCQLEDRSTCG